jgi:hypothetical protein
MSQLHHINKIKSAGEAAFPWAHANSAVATCGPYEVRQTTITRVFPLKTRQHSMNVPQDLMAEADAFLALDTTVRPAAEWRRILIGAQTPARIQATTTTVLDTSVLATAGKLGTMAVDPNTNVNNARQRLDPEVEEALSQEEGRIPIPTVIAVDLNTSTGPVIVGEAKAPTSAAATRDHTPISSQNVTPANSPRRQGILTPARMSVLPKFQPPESAQSSPARSVATQCTSSSPPTSEGELSHSEDEEPGSPDGQDLANQTSHRNRPVTPAPRFKEAEETTENITEAEDLLLNEPAPVDLEIEAPDEDL